MTANTTKEPVLRFSGFNDPWNQTRLGDVGDLYQPKTISQTDLTTEGYTVYGANGIIGKYHSFNHEKRQVAVTCRGSTCGLVNFTEPRSWITGNAMVVNLDERPDETKRFVYHALNATDLRYIITGSGQPQITGNLKEHKIGLPTLPEQRKIADYLTAVDGRIGQLSQKKALLEDYKKGVMQQLFTQALRFKDDHGNDFPDWEEKKYSEIYTFQNTNSYSRDLLTYEGGEVRNIHYGDIHTKFRSNFYLSKEVVPFIKPEVELKRIAKDCYCRVGDLVIADASEDYADVGKCIEIMELGEKTLAGLHTFIARPRKGAVSPGFGGYLMQSREVRLKIMTIAQGTKVLGLSKNMLCNIKLPIPHLEEQTKIANFLTALDRKIESVSQQITHTQAFKKGLLQQMFV